MYMQGLFFFSCQYSSRAAPLSVFLFFVVVGVVLVLLLVLLLDITVLADGA